MTSALHSNAAFGDQLRSFARAIGQIVLQRNAATGAHRATASTTRLAEMGIRMLIPFGCSVAVPRSRQARVPMYDFLNVGTDAGRLVRSVRTPAWGVNTSYVSGSAPPRHVAPRATAPALRPPSRVPSDGGPYIGGVCAISRAVRRSALLNCARRTASVSNGGFDVEIRTPSALDC